MIAILWPDGSLQEAPTATLLLDDLRSQQPTATYASRWAFRLELYRRAREWGNAGEISLLDLRSDSALLRGLERAGCLRIVSD